MSAVITLRELEQPISVGTCNKANINWQKERDMEKKLKVTNGSLLSLIVLLALTLPALGGTTLSSLKPQ